MLQDYKLRQFLYYKNIDPSDFINGDTFFLEPTDDETLAKEIINYFNHKNPPITYPSKSFAVAIIYADLLKKYFNVPPLEALEDDDLFLGSDKYFKSYKTSPRVYDLVFKTLSFPIDLNLHLPQIRTTVQAFEREFFIEERSLEDVIEKINRSNYDL